MKKKTENVETIEPATTVIDEELLHSISIQTYQQTNSIEIQKIEKQKEASHNHSDPVLSESSL